MRRRHDETMNQWTFLNKSMSLLADQIRRISMDESRTKLLEWLVPPAINHSRMYNDSRNKHTLRGQTNGSLKTQVGAGKSIMSSSIINRLLQKQQSDQLIAVAYFYISVLDQPTQDPAWMFRSLIKQVSCCRPVLPESVQKLRNYKDKGHDPELVTLQTALLDSLSVFAQVYVVIDALDESSSNNDQRATFLRRLQNMILKAPENLHILCTSRRGVQDVDQVFRDLVYPKPQSSLWKAEIDLSSPDQQSHVNIDIEKTIDDSLKGTGWSQDLEYKAREILNEKAQGMFQYVAYHLATIKRLGSEDDIRAALNDLPEGLDKTYDQLFRKIDKGMRQRVANCLKWLAFARRPLYVYELVEIFSFRNDKSPPISRSSRWNEQRVWQHFPSILNIEGSYNPDLTEETNLGQQFRNYNRIVTFAHPSIQQYLIRETSQVGDDDIKIFYFTQEEAHKHILEDCLASLASRREKHGLQIYAAEEWWMHLEEIPYDSLSDSTKDRICEILLAYDARRICDPFAALRSFNFNHTSAIFHNHALEVGLNLCEAVDLRSIRVGGQFSFTKFNKKQHIENKYLLGEARRDKRLAMAGSADFVKIGGRYRPSKFLGESNIDIKYKSQMFQRNPLELTAMIGNNNLVEVEHGFVRVAATGAKLDIVKLLELHDGGTYMTPEGFEALKDLWKLGAFNADLDEYWSRRGHQYFVNAHQVFYNLIVWNVCKEAIQLLRENGATVTFSHWGAVVSAESYERVNFFFRGHGNGDYNFPFRCAVPCGEQKVATFLDESVRDDLEELEEMRSRCALECSDVMEGLGEALLSGFKDPEKRPAEHMLDTWWESTGLLSYWRAAFNIPRQENNANDDTAYKRRYRQVTVKSYSLRGRFWRYHPECPQPELLYF
ncbi:hypothetical protein B0T17DRAFT_597336 [Bombardia bombarda]|uniref:Nephrocystin 3-like N-terminal domain-containing protein n=1 Tax=Bombardia bombarda TaxID=252184 RepID=A0AA40C7V9_9PEZI|nr:hypothetical protein B0T17DRAFT_597336 [Bombardia bombarda]